ncbi:AsmA-like C-terminal region-containing protein [Marinobacterium sp. MBR-109]|jgi:uncharacterized protein (TIGR02099 family)|uniref:YhdP family phospholipid transporter n=1 Tax=Marinobacterium sp. MBR-109 TaxID=3156462 RepID=UPI003391476B
MRRHLSRAWWIFLLLLLLLALLLTAARLVLESADRFRPQAEHWLSEVLELPVQLDRMQGSWRYAYPVLQVQGVSARTPADDPGSEGSLKINRLELELDLLASLLEGVPIFQRFEVEGVDLRWHQRGGHWLHRPGAEPGKQDQGLSPSAWEQLVGLLIRQPYAVIRDVHITLIPEQGVPLVITPADLELENAPHEHRLSGLFRMPELGADAGVHFAIETDLATSDPLKARYRFYLQAEDLGPELFQMLELEPELAALDLDLELWADVRNQQLQSLQAEVGFERLQLTDPDLSQPQAGRFTAALLQSDRGYQLQLQPITLLHEQAELTLPLVVVDLDWQERQLDLRRAFMAELDLAATAAWLGVAEGVAPELVRLLQQLQPRGQLRQLRLEKPLDGRWSELTLSAELDAVGVDGWRGAPALQGVSGQLLATPYAGLIQLDSHAFDMHFPELYPQGWRYRQASGEIRWQLDEAGVRVSGERLQLHNRQVNAAGRFSIDLPFDSERQADLILMIGMTDSDGSQASLYTPEKEVGSGLYNWLESAVQAGHLRQAGMLLRTGTRSLGESSTPVVQLFFDIKDARLDYQPGWPAIEQGDLFVLVKEQGLAININRATLLDSDIPSGWAYLSPGSRQLEIETLLDGPASDIDQVLKTTPLADLVGQELQQWQLEGKALTRLGLSIPLVEDRAPEARVAVDLSDGRFGSQSLGLELEDVEGQFSYTSTRGFSATNIRAKAWGGPVSASVTSERDSVKVSLRGQTDLAILNRWLEQPLLDMVTGTTRWQGELLLCADASCPMLELYSDLIGVELPLPGVLFKPAEVAAPLTLKLDLNTPVQVQQVELELARVGTTAETIKLSGTTDATGLALDISGADLQGKVLLPQADEPLKVHLERLQLNALMQDDAPEMSPVTEHDSFYPQLLGRIRLPAADIRVDSLWLGEKALGDWRFSLRPDERGTRISGLEAYLDQLVLRGEAHWNQQKEQQTELTLRLVGDDLGALLERWHYGRVLETSRVESLLQLNWKGAPWDVSLDRLNGELQFSTREGRLIETAESTNLLRVFGILNFNSLARRLRLDFSDLLKKGVSFDRLDGHYRLQQGIATTVEPLVMAGPSANMSVQGRVNLAAGTLDKEVEVALPISSNVPLAAVLLGAPQVAGAVFVIDKLIGDRLERFSTLRYRLTGSWENPELDLLTGSGD